VLAPATAAAESRQHLEEEDEQQRQKVPAAVETEVCVAVGEVGRVLGSDPAISASALHTGDKVERDT